MKNERPDRARRSSTIERATMPASFLQEMAYQYLTDKETRDRVQVWQAFRQHSDAELAAQCKERLGLERSPFSTQELTEAFAQLRVANAGDLGVYALKLLGGGNLPLRPRISPRPSASSWPCLRCSQPEASPQPRSRG